MADPLIILDQLYKTFGDTVATNRLSMSVSAGEIFGFLGANGAGKTTTIRMLCGLLKPSGGRAWLEGRDVWTERHAIRSKFGYVAQKFSLYSDLTVMENLRFFSGAYRIEPVAVGERINSLISHMDLEPKRNEQAGSLSGGMKQMLAIACALIHQPVVLFLDEPTAGLDPVHREQIWDLLYTLSQEGTTIFVTTHYMDEASRCTDVGFLHEGLLMAKDSPRALTGRFKTKVLEIHVEPVMAAPRVLRREPGILGASLKNGRVRIYAADPHELLEEWQRRWPFPELRLISHTWIDPDMEDVFKAYSQGYQEILK